MASMYYRVILFYASVVAFPTNVFSQILGDWRVREYYTETRGLTEEIEEIRRNIKGYPASISQNRIVLPGGELDGVLELDAVDFEIIDLGLIDLPDSVPNASLQFFCQEIWSFNAVTKGTIAFINENYKEHYIKVYTFHVGKLDSAYVYFFDSSFVALCVPSDGVYLLDR